MPNNNLGLNSKKPYLENKSRKLKVPFLFNETEVLLQKKFFDYMLSLASKGKVNVYINDEGIRAFKNVEMIDKDFTRIYLRIKKGNVFDNIAIINSISPIKLDNDKLKNEENT